MKTLTIRVSDEEHKLMQAAAARRFMSITGITRAHFGALFVEDGLVLDPVAEAKRTRRDELEKDAAAKAKPQVERLPIPLGQSALRDAVYMRVNRGESLSVVAESYGIQMDVIKAMYKRAKESAESESQPYEIISKEVLNDPEQMRVINDAKFAEIMANLDENA